MNLEFWKLAALGRKKIPSIQRLLACCKSCSNCSDKEWAASFVWWLERNRLWVVGHFQFRLSVPIGSTDSLLDIASQLLESRPRASLIVLASNTRRNVLE